jgi:hypothetical protein
MVLKRSNQILTQIDLNLVQTSDDFSSNVSVDKFFRKFKMFSKDIEVPIASDETNERDCSVWDVINFRQCELWGWKDGSVLLPLDKLQGGFTFEATIAMVPIVEELKVLGLRSEVAIATKPLPSEESPIVSIIEALHDSITPRFSCRNEDDLDPQQQTESQNDAKGTRVTIASSKTEFVVDLEKIWNTRSLPTAEQAQSYGLVVFPSLRVEKDSVAAAIDDIERIEAPIVFDVSGTHEIHLMDMIDSQRPCKIGIFDPFGDIRSFF